MENIKIELLLSSFPSSLKTALYSAVVEWDGDVYITGGIVRDFLLGRVSNDLDLTIKKNSLAFCSLLKQKLGGGVYIPLTGRAEEDAGRVAWQGMDVDVAGFREGALTIEEDLGKRDFTMNSMAVRFNDKEGKVLDPYGGRKHLQEKILVCLPGCFQADPLRMLRGYRMQAIYSLEMDKKCHNSIKRLGRNIESVSRERICHELDLIMESDKSHDQLTQMFEDKLLYELLPELSETEGVEQPDFHHLDVFQHSLETVKQLENIFDSPERYFPSGIPFLEELIHDKTKRRRLKWAALFHDIGKPHTMVLGKTGGVKTTFHNHDRVGKELFSKIAERLRWSGADTTKTAELILYHMHPFFLANLLRDNNLTERAIIRLVRRAGEQLTDLFCLAMADSLASQGHLKPEGMESELDHLFRISYDLYLHRVRPVFQRKRFLTGKDLVDTFGLKPGPVFKKILDEVEILSIEGSINSEEEGKEWFQRNKQSFLSD